MGQHQPETAPVQRPRRRISDGNRRASVPDGRGVPRSGRDRSHAARNAASATMRRATSAVLTPYGSTAGSRRPLQPSCWWCRDRRHYHRQRLHDPAAILLRRVRRVGMAGVHGAWPAAKSRMQTCRESRGAADVGGRFERLLQHGCFRCAVVLAACPGDVHGPGPRHQRPCDQPVTPGCAQAAAPDTPSKRHLREAARYAPTPPPAGPV